MKLEVKERRRRQIVEAALATFATRGYDKTTMEDIRAASDVSKGTLYLYFDSKEALFAAVVEAAFADIQDSLDALLVDSVSTSASDRIETYLRGLVGLLGESDQRIGLYTDFFVQAWQSAAVRGALAEAYFHYTAILAALIQQGVEAGSIYTADAHLTARVITSAFDGIVLQKLADPQGDLRPALEDLSSLFLRGLQQPIEE